MRPSPSRCGSPSLGCGNRGVERQLGCVLRLCLHLLRPASRFARLLGLCLHLLRPASRGTASSGSNSGARRLLSPARGFGRNGNEMGCFFPRHSAGTAVSSSAPAAASSGGSPGGSATPRRRRRRRRPARFRDRHRLRQRCSERHAGFLGGLAGIQAGEFASAARPARPPVAYRDPVIVGMDLAESEKAVAIAAVFDKGGLQRRLDPRNFAR